MIAITGANGNLGKATIQKLLQSVSPSGIVAIARNLETIREFQVQGIVVRQADYNDFNSLKAAFKGVEKALQISTVGVDLETAKRQEQNVVYAMAENQVKHIAYTSMVQARAGAIFQGTTTHCHTEELIKATKIPYTFFRNNMYMEAIPALIGDALKTGEIRYPSGDGKVGYVSRNDIAEAIANVLTENTRKNQIYEITGIAALSFQELASLISLEKNVDIKHVDISAMEFREALLNFQLPIHVVDLLVSMANGIKKGEFSHVENSLEKLLGRSPLTVREYLKRDAIFN